VAVISFAGGIVFRTKIAVFYIEKAAFVDSHLGECRGEFVHTKKCGIRKFFKLLEGTNHRRNSEEGRSSRSHTTKITRMTCTHKEGTALGGN